MKRNYFSLLLLIFSLTSFAQLENTVIVEHFTNTRCSVCASKNPAFYSVMDNYSQVLHIAYHPSSPYSNCLLSQHNPQENDSRANYYDLYGSTPKLVLQGQNLPVQTPLIRTEDIESQLGMTSDYKLSVILTLISGDDYKAELEVERVSGNTTDDLLIYVGLAEKQLNYEAPNGEDVHYDVFRKMLTDENISLPNIGEIKNYSLEFSMHTDWVEEEIFAYAIIQDANDKSVFQSGSSYQSPSAISNETINEVTSVFYPNPSSGLVNIQSEYLNEIKKIEIYSLMGRKVKEVNNINNLDINDLTEGMYFAKITNHNNEVYSSRLIKKQ